jgi:hypothetical protein
MSRHIGSPFRNNDMLTAIKDESVVFCAIYGIGKPHGQGPVCIGYVGHDHDRARGEHGGERALANTLSAFDGEIALAIAWAVDWKLARRVVKRCYQLLKSAGKTSHDGWYAINRSWAKRVIATAAALEHIPIYSSGDLDRLRVSRADWHERALRKKAGLVAPR